MIEPVIIGDCTLYHGDNRDVLRQFQSDSLDSCVTDPPYALVSIVKRFGGANAAPAKGNTAYMRASAGFMGKQWDTGEVAFSEEFWAEVYRVLKPGAFVAAFGASRGYHRMACAIEDAGFEIRDSLMWVYGTGFPKSHDVSKGIDKAAGVEREIVGYAERPSGLHRGKIADYSPANDDDYSPPITAPATDAARQWEGWGTALKPAFEPIVLARKPLSEGTVAANVLRWGTGALNIDGCRVATTADDDIHAKNPHTVNKGSNEIYGAFRKDGSYPSYNPSAGRWPANVVTDGSDEVIGMFPNTHGAGATRPKREQEYEGKEGWGNIGKGASGFRIGDAGGSASRFFYSAKASKQDRAGSKHPTIKPVALMQWLARLITPPGGMVLDPFAGSGTTGHAAISEGFNVVLCEREDEYVEDIKRRMSDCVAHAKAEQPANDNEPQLDIFGKAA